MKYKILFYHTNTHMHMYIHVLFIASFTSSIITKTVLFIYMYVWMMYTHVCICTHKQTHVWACMWKPEAEFGCLLQLLSTLIFRQLLSHVITFWITWKSSVSQSGWLGVSLFLTTWHWCHRCTPDVYIGAQDPISNPQIFATTSTSLRANQLFYTLRIPSIMYLYCG